MPNLKNTRIILKTLFFSMICFVLMISAAKGSTPSSGSLSPSSPSLSFTGGPFPVSNPSDPVGMTPPVCTDVTCGVFTLTVNIPNGDPTNYKVSFSVGWVNSGTTTQGSATSDYDVFIYQPDVTGTETTQAATGPAGNPEVGSFRVPTGSTTYTFYVVPYDVSSTVSFSAVVNLVNATPPPPTPIPNVTLPPGTPRFFNYMSPNGLADSWGEPSIGADWITGKVMFFGGLSQYTTRVSFDDSTSPAKTTWDRNTLFLNTLPRAGGIL